jgi:hypothetical protein
MPASVAQKRLARFRRQSGRLHQPPHGRGRHSLEHRHPAIGRCVGRKGLTGCLGQLIGHLGREPDPGIGWPGRQPQRPNQSPLAQVRSNLIEPFPALRLDPAFKRLPQRRGQLPGFFVASDVGTGKDRP